MISRMQRSILLVVALLAIFGANAEFVDSGSKVTPVQKVLELLNGMLEKGKQEKHEEMVQFAKFKQFCEDTTREKTTAIEKATEQIGLLKADIQTYAADAARLTEEIAGHDDDIDVWTKDVKAATNVRDIEKTDYDATHKDYSESISALERAIAVLKKQDYDRKQAPAEAEEESFTQVAALKNLNLIPAEAKNAITLFLQQDEPEEATPEGLEVTAPEANAYEFQSGHIIEMLEKLLDKFIAERTELEKEEMDSVHEFQMLMQDLKASIEQATIDRTEKTEFKAKSLQAKADAEGDLTDTTTTRDEDVKYLTDLTATCETKATEFEARTTLRVQELEAIEKAMEIISSSSLEGNAEKYLPTFVQTKNSAALSQLRADGHNPTVQQRAVMYLQRQAGRLNSRVLAALASKVASDPFAKVKKMIKDLITRLMEEATEEAEHKGWCDTELSTNEQTRKEKTKKVEELHALIDELGASIAKLSEDLAKLAEEVAHLDAAMAEATALRAEEKAENTQTIEEAQEAETAVAQALLVLKEFYAKAGEATALLQQQPEMPEIFDSPYKGMQAENGGVVGMSEVIQQDFARLEADTATEEETAEKAYQDFMTDSKVDKASKESDIKNKTAKKQDQSNALTLKKSDLEGTQKELDAALDYYDKLKPSCVDAGVSYDDRVTRRKEEIQSLQEALRILNGEDFA